MLVLDFVETNSVREQEKKEQKKQREMQKKELSGVVNRKIACNTHTIVYISLLFFILFNRLVYKFFLLPKSGKRVFFCFIIVASRMFTFLIKIIFSDSF